MRSIRLVGEYYKVECMLLRKKLLFLQSISARKYSNFSLNSHLHPSIHMRIVLKENEKAYIIMFLFFTALLFSPARRVDDDKKKERIASCMTISNAKNIC
jgi:hypothetical protein